MQGARLPAFMFLHRANPGAAQRGLLKPQTSGGRWRGCARGFARHQAGEPASVTRAGVGHPQPPGVQQSSMSSGPWRKHEHPDPGSRLKLQPLGGEGADGDSGPGWKRVPEGSTSRTPSKFGNTVGVVGDRLVLCSS